MLMVSCKMANEAKMDSDRIITGVDVDWEYPG